MPCEFFIECILGSNPRNRCQRWQADHKITHEAKRWCFARGVHPRHYARWSPEIKQAFHDRYDVAADDPTKLVNLNPDTRAQNLIARELKLPRIKGSPRQIKYASDIRAWHLGIGMVDDETAKIQHAEWWIERYQSHPKSRVKL